MKSPLFLLLLVFIFLSTSSCSHVSAEGKNTPAIHLKAEDKKRLTQAIWRNECGGTVSGLTSWNQGEGFPSLGIGHFIWYPEGKKGIYEESFPAFIQYAKKAGANPPAWTAGAAPWNSRDEFLKEQNGPRLTQLRQWLASTTSLQTDFIIARSAAALPKLKAASQNPKQLEKKYNAVASTPNGMYALVDYVNFKGEGTNPAERYKGQGWGLAQVLDAMPETASGQQAAQAFSKAARQVLSRRVANSPAERKESRWLPGWHNRCDTYARPL